MINCCRFHVCSRVINFHVPNLFYVADKADKAQINLRRSGRAIDATSGLSYCEILVGVHGYEF